MATNSTVQIKILGDSENAKKAFSSLNSTVQGSQSKLGGIAKGIGGFVAGAATIGAGLLASVAGVGISTAAEFEQMEVAFGTLMGSSAKAKKEMQWLKDSAAATPFELTDLTAADKTLLNFGFTSDKVRHDFMNSMGNMAAAVGLPSSRLPDLARVFGQVQASGRASLEDVNQLIDAGIPVWDALKKATGKSVSQIRKDISDGKISAETFNGALQKFSDNKFGDAMQKQGQTLNGMWSTLKDTFALGAMDMIKPLMPLIKEMMPKMAALMGTIGQAVAAAIPKIMAFATNAKAIWDGFFAGGGATRVSGIFDTVKGVIMSVIPYFQQFASFVQTTIFPAFQQMWVQVQPVLTQLWSTVQTVFQAIKVGIQAAVTFIQLLWSNFGQSLLNGVQAVWSGIMNVIRGVLTVIQGIANLFIGIFTGNWSRAWQGIKQIFSGVWTAIKGVFSIAFNSIKTGLAVGLGVLKSLWTVAWNAIGAVASSIWNRIKSIVSGAINGVKGALSGGVNGIKALWSAGWNAMKTAVSTAWNGMSSFIRGIPGKILGFFSGVGSLLTGIGGHIIDGLVAGIRGALGRVQAAAQWIIDKIPGPIRSALGIASPSKVMKEIGKWITIGLAKGMTGSVKYVQSAVKTLHQKIYKGMVNLKGGKKGAKAYSAFIKKILPAEKQLVRIAAQRESVAKRLATAKTNLSNALKARADYAGKVKESAMDFAKITNIENDGLNPMGGNTLLQGLQKKLGQIRAFTAKIAQLKKMGLNNTTLDQIVQAGVEGGAEYADALISGGVGNIKQVNSVQSQINSAAGALGNTSAGAMYNAGIQAAAGLVKGLTAQSKNLAKAATTLANALVKAVKKALGIKSPSRVFAGIGVFAGQGLVKGLDSMQKPVGKSASGLASTAAGSASASIQYGQSRTSGGGGGDIHIHVAGSVVTEKQLIEKVRQGLQRTGNRNGGAIFA